MCRNAGSGRRLVEHLRRAELGVSHLRCGYRDLGSQAFTTHSWRLKLLANCVSRAGVSNLGLPALKTSITASIQRGDGSQPLRLEAAMITLIAALAGIGGPLLLVIFLLEALAGS